MNRSDSSDERKYTFGLRQLSINPIMQKSDKILQDMMNLDLPLN